MPSVSSPCLNSPLESTSKSTTTLPPTAMPLISPTALLHAHLAQTPPTRPLARSPDQPQSVDLNTSSLTHTHGSSVVKIGATTIICGVRAEVLPISEIPSYDAKTTPPLSSNNTDEQDQETTTTWTPETHTPIALYNLVVPNLELSTNCSPLHPVNTAPSTQAQSLSQRLYSLLLTSNLIQSSDLAIRYTPPAATDEELRLDADDPAYIPFDEEVKAFWVLYIDMVCISYGGESSVFDAAWLSLYAALKDTLLPRAWWDQDEKAVLCDPDVRMGRRLRLNGVPVSVGFGVVRDMVGSGKGGDARKWVLIDPDSYEEQCCDEVGCVVVDMAERGSGKGRIVRVEKSGGGVVGPRELKEILGVVEGRWQEWVALMERTMGESLKTG